MRGRRIVIALTCAWMLFAAVPFTSSRDGAAHRVVALTTHAVTHKTPTPRRLPAPTLAGIVAAAALTAIAVTAVRAPDRHLRQLVELRVFASRGPPR